MKIWEVAARTIVTLGSRPWGKCLLESTCVWIWFCYYFFIASELILFFVKFLLLFFLFFSTIFVLILFVSIIKYILYSRMWERKSTFVRKLIFLFSVRTCFLINWIFNLRFENFLGSILLWTMNKPTGIYCKKYFLFISPVVKNILYKILYELISFI